MTVRLNAWAFIDGKMETLLLGVAKGQKRGSREQIKREIKRLSCSLWLL